MHRQITYMKDLNYYLSLPYRMELTSDKPEGDFVVSFPALPGCLSCGETIEEAITNGNDAKMAWLETSLEQGMINRVECIFQHPPVAPRRTV
ncbi:MAG: type II toxin-antitoxin system HicB family antitoxin, partial [Erysipelotrichaceae bacterium]